MLVEAFSLRGLGRLAEAREKDPPFASDNAFRNRNCRISREYYSGASRRRSASDLFATLS